MANPRMTLLDLLNKAEQGADPDFLRDGLKLLLEREARADIGLRRVRAEYCTH